MNVWKWIRYQNWYVFVPWNVLEMASYLSYDTWYETTYKWYDAICKVWNDDIRYDMVFVIWYDTVYDIGYGMIYDIKYIYIYMQLHIIQFKVLLTKLVQNCI